jgi:CheY-like chemotaxis protein
LEVVDSGCGMDSETRQRIFEPFYSTKFTGRGLGMSAVLGIIRSHKGALQLFSQPGQGSTFKVYLPVFNDGVCDVVSCQRVVQPPWQGSGTILLVEDEEQLLHVVKAILKSMGFSVIEASNGKLALEVYQKYAAEISLVLTDIGMPVMDGYGLFRELKKLDPKLPIIISSGFGDAEVTAHIPGDQIAGLVSKPYNFDQLREVLKSVVEGRGDRG